MNLYRQMMTRSAAVAFLALLGTVVAAAQGVSAEQSTKIDALFAKWDRPSTPGCTLSVLKGGQVIYKRAYGMANLDYGVVLTTDTPFHVASVSKQFTAASIVLLEQEGKLSFDDEVRRFVPELPDFGRKITIRQLLHHTSGLRDQWDLLQLAGWRYSLDLITNEDVLSVVTRQKELNFAPGSEYSYSNTGYTLLGEIVKRVSGKSLREFTTERIFVPLGMKNTHFRDDHAEIIPHQAYGYSHSDKKGWQLSVTNFDTVGATSLFTTVEDLALWDENFYSGRVGGPHFTETMLHHDPLTSGENIPYAFGLTTGKYRGLDIVEHAGADAGYRSELLRFPGQHFSVACLCNNGGAAGPGTLAEKVADILLAADLQATAAPKAEEKFVTLSEAQVTPKVGYYRDHEKDEIRKVVRKDAGLGVAFGDNVLPLKARSPDRFQLAEYPVAVEFSSGRGGLLEMKIGRPDEKRQSYEQLPAYTLPEGQKKEYEGNYRSPEIDPVYRIAEENGRLVLQRLKHEAETLEAAAPDLFQGELGTFRFERDQKGRVTAMLITTGRIRNLRFVRER
ncbi:MAG TPA: serine hydrolase domain-containing protein [Candidatus Saccharimonadales bacterium]|nr:serine hydrolase domain-containing protein [Candidatus Saccharimonadales bacterium]